MPNLISKNPGYIDGIVIWHVRPMNESLLQPQKNKIFYDGMKNVTTTKSMFHNGIEIVVTQNIHIS